jgi:hypothetical protein
MQLLAITIQRRKGLRSSRQQSLAQAVRISSCLVQFSDLLRLFPSRLQISLYFRTIV